VEKRAEQERHGEAIPLVIAALSPAGQAGRTSRTLITAALIVLFVALVSYWRIAHETTIIWTHFAYIPVALAGLWWGLRSVWLAVLLGGFVLGLGICTGGTQSLLADLLRACFFIGAALCVGTVSSRATAARKAEEESRRELELTQRRLHASERLALMGQLSAGVAHELNNPLGTILIYAHMLLKELPEDDPSREDIRMIASEGARCKNIVRGLLDFARQSRVRKAPTDIAVPINDVLALMQPKAEEASARLTADIEDGLPTMMIDADQIKQMLVNLVQNGLDAVADAGEVTVSARRGERPDSVVVSVRDNGCGISAENRAKLFTPFFTTKEPGKGTGLGLAIAYGVVKLHSGDITVESEPGNGAIFSVVLPVGYEPETGACQTAAQGQARLPS